jgi:hypothetical protein
MPIVGRPITEADAKEITDVMQLLQQHLINREAGLVMVVLQGMVANGVLALTEDEASTDRAEAMAEHVKLFINGTLGWIETYLATRPTVDGETAAPSSRVM